MQFRKSKISAATAWLAFLWHILNWCSDNLLFCSIWLDNWKVFYGGLLWKKPVSTSIDPKWINLTPRYEWFIGSYHPHSATLALNSLIKWFLNTGSRCSPGISRTENTGVWEDEDFLFWILNLKMHLWLIVKPC
jgi:hypothetical protein